MDDKGFKYQIGDVVQHKSFAYVPQAPKKIRYLYQPRTATPLIVLSRLWEECPGGVQKHYRCRSNILAEMLTLHEEEVEPYVTA